VPKWQARDGLGSRLMNYDRLLWTMEDVHRYALLNERVLQVAKRELKELYDLGQCDVLSSPKAQKVEPLKCCVSNYFAKTLNVKTTNDLLLELIPLFQIHVRNYHQTQNTDTFIKNGCQ
jgi:hypothetical protein